MRQLHVAMLTPKNLLRLSDRTINTTEMVAICNQYGVNSDIVTAELSDLRKAACKLLRNVLEDEFISDLKSKTREQSTCKSV